MAKNKKEKKSMIDRYTKRIKEAKAMYFVEMQGLEVNEAVKLKLSLNNVNASFNVVKNTLFQKALQEILKSKSDSILNYFDKGSHAIVFANNDVSVPAKIVFEFAKESKKFTINSGYFEGKMLSNNDVEELATLPSKEVMLSRVLATMNAPLTNFMLVSKNIIQNFALVIKAISEK